MRINSTLKTVSLVLLGLYLILTTTLVFFLTRADRIVHAVVSMGTGLILVWVCLCGSLMYLFRDRLKAWILRIRMPWAIKFVLFCILLAMVEEAVTTTMTNLAPVFGVRVGQAYITASANYLDVILHHSVIVFIPWFLAWAWIQKCYSFSPYWVFLLFGLNGLLAESLTFGQQHLSEFAMWIFVYGLMIYLPAYTLPEPRGSRPPKVWHALFAFVIPFLISIPWAIFIHWLSPDHPNIHFPPFQP